MAVPSDQLVAACSPLYNSFRETMEIDEREHLSAINYLNGNLNWLLLFDG